MTRAELKTARLTLRPVAPKAVGLRAVATLRARVQVLVRAVQQGVQVAQPAQGVQRVQRFGCASQPRRSHCA